MMNKIVFITIVLSIIGCGQDNIERVVQPDVQVQHDTQTVYVPVQAPVAVSTEQDDINQVIKEENDYRFSTGQAPLTLGLTCTLHNLAATTPATIPASPPAAVATFVYQGQINQPNMLLNAGINMLPVALRPTYTQWYMIKCQGQLVFLKSEFVTLSVTSDDGSNLYLDGVLLVNNDGNHGAQLRNGTKNFKRGVHTFRLDYMQGPGGNSALILEDNNGIINGNRFYR